METLLTGLATEGLGLHHILMFLSFHSAGGGYCNLMRPREHDAMIHSKMYILRKRKDTWNMMFLCSISWSMLILQRSPLLYLRFAFLQNNFYPHLRSIIGYKYFLKTYFGEPSINLKTNQEASQTILPKWNISPQICVTCCLFIWARCSISQSGHIQQARFPNKPNEKNNSTIQCWVDRDLWHICVSSPISSASILLTHKAALYCHLYRIPQSATLQLVKCISSS